MQKSRARIAGIPTSMPEKQPKKLAGNKFQVGSRAQRMRRHFDDHDKHDNNDNNDYNDDYDDNNNDNLGIDGFRLVAMPR